MASRYAKFVIGYGARREEYRLVRNWLGRFVNDKNVTRVDGGMMPLAPNGR